MKDKKYSGGRGSFYNLLNKDIKELNIVFLSLFCILILLGAGLLSYKITNSYALFSNIVKGERTIELKVPTTEIRITRAKLKSSENGGTELTKSRYQQNQTSMNVNLPNEDSSVTYEVRITAPEDKTYDLSKIIVEENTNENIKYEIEGISIGDKIEADQSVLFTIKFYYDGEITENINTNLILKYEFAEHIDSYLLGNYDYKNDCQSIIIPHKGIYKIELWGASGGHSRCQGVSKCGTLGLGSYTSGDIEFEEGKEIFLCIGGKGGDAAPLIDSPGGFNGGGDGLSDGSEKETNAGEDEGSGGGGGATDVRLVEGKWNNFDSLKSRIMVAAGGAGAVWKNTHTFHSGGGLSTDIYNKTFEYEHSTDKYLTITSHTLNTTQKSGYKFGIGAKGVGLGYSDGSPGGGGGYYGGNEHHEDNTDNKYDNLSAGGSSFISGHNGCDAISENSTENNIIHTGQSIHYSNYKFTNTIMIDGEGYNWTTTKGTYTQMLTYDGTGKMTGNTGNGHAKITFIKRTY